MVSPVHRFLYGLDLHASDLKQVWVVEGSGATDTFFHDVYHGCVDLKTTLQLWAHESAGPHGDVIAAVLTRDARLDFSVNADPEEAQGRFNGSSRRKPRYGSRPGASVADAAHTSDEATQAAAHQAAERVSGTLGSGQGLQNLLVQVRAAFQRGSCPMLVVVEDLHVMFRGMVARGEMAAAHEIVVATQDLVNSVKAGRPGRVLVLLDPRSGLFSDELLDPGEDIRRTTVPAPEAAEISASIGRASRRAGFRLSQPLAIGKVLTAEGSLNAALGRVARAHARGFAVDLESVLDLPPQNEGAVAEILGELRSLVGMDGPGGVQSKVESLVLTARARRRDLVHQGLVPESTLHMVFAGNPGTGKTTVANIIGRLFHALGLLPRATVIEGKVSEIVASAIGQTRQNMQQLLRSAQGGVLFIDEAHQLAKDNGEEALEALVPFAENHRTDSVIILAGYPDGLRELFAVDPGLPSRFSHTFLFEDYNDEDLWQMLVSGLESRNWSLAPEAEPRLRRLMSSRRKRPGFDNGRGVRNLRDELEQKHFDREDTSRVIGLEDLPLVAQPHPKELAEAQAQLDRLAGLEDLRALLNRFRTNVEYAQSHASPLPPMEGLRFVGPPGTGKTTVARILAKYLYGLGVLETTRTIETSGTQLKGAYLGQTAPKVAELFEKARGGVLFIDEIYGIADQGQPDSFGREAIDTLVQQLTVPQNAGTVVVVAGYEDRTDVFIGQNPGLARRFPVVVRFSTFAPAQLLAIAESWAIAQEWRLADDFGPLFRQVAANASTAHDFGNAAWAETITQRASEVMKERVQSGDSNDGVLTADDLTIAVRSQYPLLLPEAPHLMPQGEAVSAPVEHGWSAEAVELPPPPPTSTLATDVQVADFVAARTFPLTAVLQDGREGIGTVFPISADGLAVTATHVIANARSLRVHLNHGAESIAACVLAADDETDVAILQLSDSELSGPSPLALGRSFTLERMHRLVVAGYNQTTAEEDCHTVSAAVMRNSPTQDPVAFEVDGAVEFGASGGPVFDPEQRAVVGIVHGGLGHTVKIVRRSEQIYALLERHGWRDERDSHRVQRTGTTPESERE